MKFSGRALSALVFVLAGSFAAAQNAEFVTSEVLVKFKGASVAVVDNAAATANAAIGAQTKARIPNLLVDQVKLPSGMSVNDALAYYGSLPSVAYAERNFKKELLSTPNDPQFASQWGQKKIKCEQAWDVTKGKNSVVIAVIDTGIDLNHEDLKNKLVPGYDFSDNDSDPSYDGDHGVHTAGIAAADTNNGKGVAGTGYNCKIMPLKIFPNATDAVSAAAIIYAADHGAKVISMSYGSYGESVTEKNAVNYAWGKGVVLVGAAGNDNVNQHLYPAYFSNVICVGSTDQADHKSGFSNFGADWVDVAAPGENILSTLPGGYGNNTGTSMACPMAAGVVGLLWSIAPIGTTNAQIRAALESTTDPVVGANNFAKFGRVNAFKAVSAMDPGSVTVSNATGVTAWFGSFLNGGLPEIQATDGADLVISSAQASPGQLAGANVQIGFNGSATNLNLSQVLVEANGPSSAAGQLFIWNYSTNKYVLVKAFALRPSGVKQEKIALPKDLTNFVSGGTLVLGIRGVGPVRVPRGATTSAYMLKLGFVRVETRESL
ncbi:MAG: peptidase S8 [Fimbriimonadaceae bacterium]|nr:peptidase S8 [Fimbriimonadaceae bacterium]